jgi:type VI secretion system secreted protein Hcp
MASDLFLKLDGIDGESEDTTYSKQIELQSWSWGASNSGAVHVGSGSAASNAQMSEFNCAIYLEKSSPKLLESLCKGKHISTGTFSATKSTGEDKTPQPYLKIEFSEVFITGLSAGGSVGGGVPIASLTFSFATLKYNYYKQNRDGSLVLAGAVTFDAVKNKISA